MRPEWLRPIEEGAGSISVHDLTAFLPPEDSDPRRGAVLMLFGEADHGPDLLLIERAHHMRSHPGQIAFPGGSIDPGETAREAALREAWEETGLDPDGVDVFAELPELWLPPSNFAVTPLLAWWEVESPVGVVDPDEVHAVYRVPIRDLVGPDHRVQVRHPSGWVGPGYLIGERRDLVLWGFTAGIIARLLDYVGMAEEVTDPPMRELPTHMLQGGPTRTDAAPPSRDGDRP
ncbi:NUDIX hydrolase [Nocardioides coralli]|uniref:NUDIX hydrolase n=1 Tax=Nocardioides coralli TaxID=2872154 RepID=UPI0020173AD3|nr:CoA pyrophosphatase [Nocardioides coralli]